MQHYEDGYPLARPVLVLRTVQLTCPHCPQVVYGQTERHAAELLLIHQESSCPGPVC